MNFHLLSRYIKYYAGLIVPASLSWILLKNDRPENLGMLYIGLHFFIGMLISLRFLSETVSLLEVYFNINPYHEIFILKTFAYPFKFNLLYSSNLYNITNICSGITLAIFIEMLKWKYLSIFVIASILLEQLSRIEHRLILKTHKVTFHTS